MDKTLIVITGTTRGLGKGIKRLLTKFNLLSINRTVTDIKNNMILDLASKRLKLERFNKIINSYEKVIFISNASEINPIALIRNFSEEDIEDTIYTNYINPSKIILSIVKSNKKYVILNMTSGAAFTSNSELALYSSSKAAMHRFIEVLKVEEKDNPNALYVDNFDPGRINTDMQKNLLDKKEMTLSEVTLNDSNEVARKVYDLLEQYL